MIRIERVTLPTGLRAIARRDAGGDLIIYVSAGLDSRQQRAAVLAAVRASRRAGWGAVLPVGVLLLGGLRAWLGRAAAPVRLLGGLRAWLRTWLGRAAAPVRLHPAGWASSAAAVLGAGAIAAIVAVAPPSHGPLAGSGPVAPGGQTISMAPGGGTGPGHGGRTVRPVADLPPQAPGPSGTEPQPGRTSPGPGRTSPAPGRTSPAPGSSSPAPSRSAPPSPTPSRSSASPSPSPTPTSSPKPSPSPSPTKSGSGHCVVILGITVCLGL
jgi:hypothetical protein